jgi:ketosteroid isomerase-like protein
MATSSLSRARVEKVTKAGEPCCNTYWFVFPFDGRKLKEVTEYQDTELATRARSLSWRVRARKARRHEIGP